MRQIYSYQTRSIRPLVNDKFAVFSGSPCGGTWFKEVDPKKDHMFRILVRTKTVRFHGIGVHLFKASPISSMNHTAGFAWQCFIKQLKIPAQGSQTGYCVVLCI